MTEKSPEGSPFEALAKLSAVGFGPLGQWGTVWAESMAELGSEALHFISERVQADVDTQHRILHCTSMEELRHIQGEFIQQAIDQYTAETGKIIEMNADMIEKLGLPKIE